MTAMPERTDRTRLRRLPKRGGHDRETIEAILDEALVCHLGLIDEGGFPLTIPTLQARVGDDLYVHGSAASRTQRALAGGTEVCLTATLLDGLVLARSAVHHSVNYRSVVVFGRAEPIVDEAGKRRALEAFTEKLAPGRWAEVRPPTAKELRVVSVLRIPLREASAKVRHGPPLDDEPDYELPVWAGTVPIRIVAGEPVPDPRLNDGADDLRLPLPEGIEPR
jgi:nitroimidazol reductase NimA-like FMN-containing flavoprotein (pyridoxamine 5'-phosphate oxidase superfamily)